MSVTIVSFKIGDGLSIFVCLMVLLSTGNCLSCDVWAQAPVANWTGTLRKGGISSLRDGAVLLESDAKHYSTVVKSDGTFSFRNLQPGVYSLAVNSGGHLYHRCSRASCADSRSPWLWLIFSNTIIPFLSRMNVDGYAVSWGASQRSPYRLVIL